ncbi:MAG: hypothetical protein GX112_09515 [Clostridiaceae bacterium]|nr:hypothetical protein [Clostridiaceae bacterium]
MIETYLKLIIAILAGFAITGIALFAARKLTLLIDRRMKKQPGPDEAKTENGSDQPKSNE